MTTVNFHFDIRFVLFRRFYFPTLWKFIDFLTPRHSNPTVLMKNYWPVFCPIPLLYINIGLKVLETMMSYIASQLFNIMICLHDRI